jgi:hypothetical protein
MVISVCPRLVDALILRSVRIPKLDDNCQMSIHKQQYFATSGSMGIWRSLVNMFVLSVNLNFTRVLLLLILLLLL